MQIERKAIQAAGTALGLAFLIMMGGFLTGRDRPQVYTLNKEEVNHSVSAEELASWFIEGRRDFAVLDLRDNTAYAAGHVRNAISCPVCHSDKEHARKVQHDVPDLKKRIVIYTQKGDSTIKLPEIVFKNADVVHLEGGFEAWQHQVLDAADHPDPSLSPEEQRRRAAVSAFFLGRVAAPPPVAEGEKKRVHVRKSFANEGC